MKEKTWFLYLQLFGFLLATTASVEALMLMLTKPQMPLIATMLMASLIIFGFAAGIFTQIYAFKNNPATKHYI